MLRVSLPASASDSDRQPRSSPVARRGSQRCFCSSVPWCTIEVRGDRVRVDDARQRHPAVRELLDHADVGEQVEPEAAVLLGDRDAEQAERLHLLDDRVGILVGVLELRRDRDHLARDEAAHGLDQLARGSRDRSVERHAGARYRATAAVRRPWDRVPSAGTVPYADDGPPHDAWASGGTTTHARQARRPRGCCAGSSAYARPYRRLLIGFLVAVVGRVDRRGDPAAALPEPARQRRPRQEPAAGRWCSRSRAVGARVRQRGALARPALVLGPDRRGPHLRPAGRAVRPRAAHADRVLHPHADRRAAVAAEQRRRSARSRRSPARSAPSCRTSISLVVTLTIMFALEWRSRSSRCSCSRVHHPGAAASGRGCSVITREGMQLNAAMNNHDRRALQRRRRAAS